MTATTPPESTLPETRETPKFTGVIVHRDPRGRFAIRRPTNWHAFEIRSEEPLAPGVEVEGSSPPAASAAAPAGSAPQRKSAKKGARPRPQTAPEQPVASREGIGFAPDPNDPATVFTIWASPLGDAVVAEDVDDLRAGVDEALAQLDGCEVEVASEKVLGNLIRFERVYTFRERQGADGSTAVRKRKQWLLYVDRWLLCLTWQGSSPEEYRYWFAMANQSFLTFELPEALWFYTDRELLATLGTTNTVS